MTQTIPFLCRTPRGICSAIRLILGDVPSDGMLGGKKSHRLPTIGYDWPRIMPLKHQIYPWMYATEIKSIALIQKNGDKKDGFQPGWYDVEFVYGELDYLVTDHMRP